MRFHVYIPEPVLEFVGRGYFPSDERQVDILLQELGIRVLPA